MSSINEEIMRKEYQGALVQKIKNLTNEEEAANEFLECLCEYIEFEHEEEFMEALREHLNWRMVAWGETDSWMERTGRCTGKEWAEHFQKHWKRFESFIPCLREEKNKKIFQRRCDTIWEQRDIDDADEDEFNDFVSEMGLLFSDFHS